MRKSSGSSRPAAAAPAAIVSRECLNTASGSSPAVTRPSPYAPAALSARGPLAAT